MRAWLGSLVAVALALTATGCVSPATGLPVKHRHLRAATVKAAATTAARPVPPAVGPAGKPVLGVTRSYWAGYHVLRFTEPASHRIGVRRLRTQVWYPLAGRPSAKTPPAPGPFPVIMFAPGFMQCAGPYSDLLKYLATAGYVIVAVDFPHADCLVGNGATENDLKNEPRDLSYDLTRMLALSKAKGNLFTRLLNQKEVGIAGQSDGGAVVAAIAGDTCCTDDRVKAVAVESGDEWPPMGGAYFTKPAVPVLFSQGSADTINPPGCSITMWLADPSTRYYLDLFGATHTEPYWGITSYEKITARVTLAFFDRYLLGRKLEAQAMMTQGNVAGLSALYQNGAGGLTDTDCY